MLPTRIWEFGFGILAFLIYSRTRNFRLPFANLIALFMLAVIVVTGIFFSEASTFPGAQALIACGASAAALLCFEWREKAAFILNLPPLLYVGRISYGLYLWHWPPLVLAVPPPALLVLVLPPASLKFQTEAFVLARLDGERA